MFSVSVCLSTKDTRKRKTTTSNVHTQAGVVQLLCSRGNVLRILERSLIFSLAMSLAFWRYCGCFGCDDGSILIGTCGDVRFFVCSRSVAAATVQFSSVQIPVQESLQDDDAKCCVLELQMSSGYRLDVHTKMHTHIPRYTHSHNHIQTTEIALSLIQLMFICSTLFASFVSVPSISFVLFVCAQYRHTFNSTSHRTMKPPTELYCKACL